MGKTIARGVFYALALGVWVWMMANTLGIARMVFPPGGDGFLGDMLPTSPPTSPKTRQVVPPMTSPTAPADRSTADLVAGLAAHWLRAGLDINTRDRNEPNVVREEITRTLMRHSIPPPWITTSEERAFALTEQSS